MDYYQNAHQFLKLANSSNILTGKFNLTDAKDSLMYLDLENKKIVNCEIVGGDFASGVFSECYFEKVTFFKTILMLTSFNKCEFKDCKFKNIEGEFGINNSLVDRLLIIQ